MVGDDERALKAMGIVSPSMLTRLRKAETERDEALAELDAAKLALAAALDDRDFIQRELEQDRDLARAELASARQELALWRRYTPEESS